MTTTMTDLASGRTFVFNEALPGRDAYEEAQAQGFVGSRADWVDSLKPLNFDPAEPGWDIGRAYAIGQIVAHEAALWVALVADTGTEPGTDAGIWGLVVEFARGASAYDTAVEQGFVGDEDAWLATLNGTSVTLTIYTDPVAFDAADPTANELAVLVDAEA